MSQRIYFRDCESEKSIALRFENVADLNHINEFAPINPKNVILTSFDTDSGTTFIATHCDGQLLAKQCADLNAELLLQGESVVNGPGGGKSESDESKKEKQNESRMKAQEESIAECYKAIESLQKKEAYSLKAIERLEGQNRANLAAHKEHLAHYRKTHETLARLMKSRRQLVIRALLDWARDYLAGV